MPVIKPRTRGKPLVTRCLRLDHKNTETLFASAEFLGEATEYVLDTVFARDKGFVPWRVARPGHFVRRSHDHRKAARRPSPKLTAVSVGA